MYFNGTHHNLMKMDKKTKTETILERSRSRQSFYEKALKMFAVCDMNGLRLIVENPFSTQHFLVENFPYKASIIDRNRAMRGDYFNKPTQYWFVNCDPTTGFTEQRDKEVRRIEDAKKGEPFEQLDLGIRLITGDGIESDAEKGIELLRKASAKGEEYSKRLLAFYDDPERYYQAALTEIKKKQSADEKKIFKLMEKAAEGRQHSAKCDLGVFLLTDYSGKWDYNKGIELLQRSNLLFLF